MKMTTDKKKELPRRLTARRKILVAGFVLLAAVLWKRESLWFRLHNLIAPVEGEIVFHADRDGDGVMQLYRVIFNTGWRTAQIDQLTFVDGGAVNGVYSPDGTQILFQKDERLGLMAAAGGDVRDLSPQPPVIPSYEDGQEHGAYLTPQWASAAQIIFRRTIGSYSTDMLQSCAVNAPFVLDLTTGLETPLFRLKVGDGASLPYEAEQGAVGFRWPRPRSLFCPSDGITENLDLDLSPLASAFASTLPQDASMQMRLFRRRVVPSPTGRHLVHAALYPYHSRISGLELFEAGTWRLIQPVHSHIVSWSPDEQSLVYDARHPDGTWVLALTSAAGGWTYPLLGGDGISYFAPHWRPSR